MGNIVQQLGQITDPAQIQEMLQELGPEGLEQILGAGGLTQQ